MVPPTPKFKSQEFKAALTALLGVFDAHSLGIVLLDALERKPAEQIFAHLGVPGGVRIASLPKSQLIGRITAAFFASDDIAYQVTKELDRACQKERYIVASIPEDQAPERIGSYRAISLKRERAKLVWALARDERVPVRVLANRVIKEFFAEAAELETARSVLSGEAPESALHDLELAKSLQEQADRLREATEKVTDLESKVTRFEGERAKLLAAIGGKERVLRRESEVRDELEHQLDALKKSLREVESTRRETDLVKASEVEARAAMDDLAQKVRRLSKLASVSKTLADTEKELRRSQRNTEDLGRNLAKRDEEIVKQRDGAEQERLQLRAELDATREDLRRARKQLAKLERKSPDVDREDEPASRSQTSEIRVLILLDQANLAAAASMRFGKKVDFASLLDRLAAGRSVARAIAFVVDNGGSAFDAFADTLRRAGWELRVKRPKVFSDGRSKADWDMGIAMEAIELRDQADTILLVSGDGDFAPLLRHLRRSGQKIEIAAFPDALSAELSAVADVTVLLDEKSLE